MNNRNYPKKVKIVEVGPRDGLQNEKKVISTKLKADFITSLAATGLQEIEATSFVRPDRIAQMHDSMDLFPLVRELKTDLTCLVPNLKGLNNALSVGVKRIAIFTAISDEFNKKNINATMAESLERIAPVIDHAKDNGIYIRAYISTVFGCPYQGMTSVDRLIEVVDWLNDKSVDEISLGDTTGIATPAQVDTILTVLKKHTSLEHLALHFHDTRGMALVNTLIGLEHGIQIFDSSAGGLGGCPYAKGATGNVATEDLVYLFDSLGIDTGINTTKLAQASLAIFKELGRVSESKNNLRYLNEK